MGVHVGWRMNLSSSAHTDATRRKICLRTYAPCMQHTNTKSHNTIQQYSIHTNSIFVSRHTLCSTRHACMECRTISRGRERDKIYLHAARETGDSKDDTKIFVIVHKTLDTCYNFWMIDSWNADSAPHLLVLFHCSLVFFFFFFWGRQGVQVLSPLRTRWEEAPQEGPDPGWPPFD